MERRGIIASDAGLPARVTPVDLHLAITLSSDIPITSMRSSIGMAILTSVFDRCNITTSLFTKDLSHRAIVDRSCPDTNPSSMAFGSQSATSGAHFRIALNSSNVSLLRMTFTLIFSVTMAGFFSIQPSAIPFVQMAIIRLRIACAQRILPRSLMDSIMSATCFVVSAAHSMLPIASRMDLSW
jgi:hypothetical protein